VAPALAQLEKRTQSLAEQPALERPVPAGLRRAFAPVGPHAALDLEPVHEVPAGRSGCYPLGSLRDFYGIICETEMSYTSFSWGRIMKVLTQYLKFHTRTHRAYVHITPQVEDAVTKSGVQEGMVLVSAMHITAGVYVNDNENGLIEDIDQWLEGLAPFRKEYKHHETGEDNGDSHLKALLIHHEVIVPITAGKLDLGTWQRIFYAEFDGRRDKRVIVKVMGE
jgi:secondary thiamine-phosphate synthase enzyme